MTPVSPFVCPLDGYLEMNQTNEVMWQVTGLHPYPNKLRSICLNCIFTGRDDEQYCNDYDGYDQEHYRGSCRKYEFRCRARGESVCLPNSWLCDGRRDCTDGYEDWF